MQGFRRILVDVDATAPVHPAFAQACDLAAHAGASVTLVDVLDDIPRVAWTAGTDEHERRLVAERLRALDDLAGTRTGVPIETAVLRGKPAVALIRQVLRAGHDLVIRSHARDLVPGRLFGPVDTQLLRKCPCPVWLVGPGERRDQRRIAAAVDAESDQPDADSLNARIVDVALTFAEVQQASLTVLHAWVLYGESMLEPWMDVADREQALAKARAAADEAIEELLRPFGARAARVRREALKGEPEAVIPRFVDEQGVDLVVMGTVGRTGLAGFLMGNTAETVLRQLKGSVIAVKPPGFQSPVTLDD